MERVGGNGTRWNRWREEEVNRKRRRWNEEEVEGGSRENVEAGRRGKRKRWKEENEGGGGAGKVKVSHSQETQST